MIGSFNLVNSKKFNLKNKKVRILEEIAKGAHGSIYKCVGAENDTFSVKIIKNCPKGISKLLEVSIMSSIIHPFLNNSISIFSNESYLFIFQDLAMSDLYEYLNLGKSSDHLHDSWSFSLIKAIHVLHLNKIIHCDIKAKNILIYKDLSIKLTDFSFSCKKMQDKDSYRHRISTWSHMPLESVMKINWNEKVDIWCLGCTLYEIYYNDLIFKYQLSQNEKLNLDEKEEKIRNLTINSIADWGMNGFLKSENEKLFCKNIYNECYPEFNKYSLCEDFITNMNSEINQIILSCLRVIPKTRPTSLELLSNKYFSGNKVEEYVILNKHKNPIADSIKTDVLSKMNNKTHDQSIISVAFNIYQGISHEIIEEEIKIETCIVIASKLLLKANIHITHNREEIIKTESLICHNLHFRLLEF